MDSHDLQQSIGLPQHRKVGDVMASPMKIYHHGWNTYSKRVVAVEKYRQQDPGNVFQPMGYAYILDDRGMVLDLLNKQAEL